MEVESERKKRDVIYRMTDRRELEELWHHVNGVLVYLKQVYGDRFERIPEVIGDREQRHPHDNSKLVEVLERVLLERRYDVLLLTFLLFLSFLKEVQDQLAEHVSDVDSYRYWLRALHERSRRFLEGTGDPLEDFLQSAVMQYVLRSPVLIETKEGSHRVQAAIEGHRE